ncbi:hypothetical protein ACSSNL_02625 [Thalassobius sp. S69A]|uniref:hypothetical protein n=1 Tax=unclassified Thalassovita TaxID=2619711 RepID=UPI000C5B92A2|nr:hypothetical protein [Paracoccaceae bacterium]
MHETTSPYLATASASAPRRWLGVGTLGLLGGLLLYVAFAAPPQNLAWLGFLIAMGLGAVFLADRMRRATELSVHLTADGLQDSAGQTIATLDNIARVDRGTFAFKPSNGFILRLTHKDTRQWRPGIWWRFGRRVGIGGVMPGAQTKIMAELLQAMIAQRDGAA